MLDLENREYKKVMAFVPNDSVVFEMKNGLYYLAVPWSGRLYIDAIWWNFFKSDPYYEEGDKIPKDELDKAVKVLKTAPLPKLNKATVKHFEEVLRYEKRKGD